MYVRSFSIQINKWELDGPICFLAPAITLFWRISRKWCNMGLLLFTDRKSYMKFHLGMFSLT